MTRTLILCLLVALSVANVLDLDSSNFDSEVKLHPLTLVEFFAPWCGHCKALAPEYEKAATTLSEKGFAGRLAKVDCTVEKDICGKYGVKGYPTLKLFRADSDDPKDYPNQRKAEDISRWMIRQNTPAVEELSGDKVESFGKGDPVSVVAFVSATTNMDKYVKVAESMRDAYNFAVVKNAGGNDRIEIRRSFDDGNKQKEFDFASDTLESDVKKFIGAHSVPWVGEIGPENYQMYLERGLNFVWVFYDKDNEVLISDVISPVAKEHSTKVSFVKLDGKRWAEHGKNFGLSKTTPGIVIEDREKNKKFIYPEDDELTVDTFSKFITDYFSGNLKANVKSEEIPEDNSGAVKIVVGKTFESIVLDTSKDVLVEFYAPWCGHCKALEPTYNKLGQSFKDDPNVIIAKVDATANDTPAEIQGFPTILFYPAGEESKKAPKEYSGDRTAEAMEGWVNSLRKTKPSSRKEDL